MDTCKTCKWWERSDWSMVQACIDRQPSSEEWRPCRLLSYASRKDERECWEAGCTPRALATTDYAVLLTAPEFGCNRHTPAESKE